MKALGLLSACTDSRWACGRSVSLKPPYYPYIGRSSSSAPPLSHCFQALRKRCFMQCRRTLGQVSQRCRCITAARRMRCPFRQHWSLRASSRRKYGTHIKLRKKYRKSWLSSLAIATASEKGHRSLLDCFKTDHAASCNICVREALLAGQMHRQQKSIQEIRTAIIQGPWASAGSSSQ